MEDSVGEKVGEQMFGGRKETVLPVTAEQLRRELSERVVRDENGVQYLRYPNEEKGEQHYYPDGLIASVGEGGSVWQLNLNAESPFGGALNGLRIEFDEDGNRQNSPALAVQEARGRIGDESVILMVASRPIGETFNGRVVPGNLVRGKEREDVYRVSREIYTQLITDKEGFPQSRIILRDAHSGKYERSFDEMEPALVNDFRYVLGIR